MNNSGTQPPYNNQLTITVSNTAAKMECLAMPFTKQQMSKISNQLANEDEDRHPILAEYKGLLCHIKENASSAKVYGALNSILRIHDSQHSFVMNVLDKQTNIPDLNSIYNKCLINILTHENFHHLVEAAKKAERYPVQIHPSMKLALKQIEGRQF